MFHCNLLIILLVKWFAQARRHGASEGHAPHQRREVPPPPDAQVEYNDIFKWIKK